MASFKYFRNSFLFMFFALVGGFAFGYYYTGTLTGGLYSLFLTFVLGILEISLSFDNAVVNAKVLRDMTPVWQRRFLTWGILIAVFGMRIVFPLLIVSVIGGINPWAALVLATTQPEEYSRMMLSSHVALSGFGGSFLLMVGLSYFFDASKEHHWLGWIEKPLVQLGRIRSVEIGFCLLLLYLLTHFLPVGEQMTLMAAGICGLLTYISVDGIGAFLEMPESTTNVVQKSGAASFIYLEILDASFSFDGVIGAFALTNNLFVIALGLGIGAMFVRSLTIYLVDMKTLEQFAYLEHGAFYAIIALASIMLLNPFFHFPEVFTGLIGATLIGLSIFDSVRKGRNEQKH